MAYTPPVGTADLSIGSVLGYTPPVGTANLSIGHTDSLDRQVWIDGATAAPTGAIHLRKQRMATIAGTTAAPTGHIQICKLVQGVIAGITAAPTGRLRSHYDPNLLSVVHQVYGADWQDGDGVRFGERERFQPASWLRCEGPDGWRDGEPLPEATASGWNPSAFAAQGFLPVWQDSAGLLEGKTAVWHPSPRLEATGADRWQEAAAQLDSLLSRFRVRLPLSAHSAIPLWQHGDSASRSVRDRMRDGQRLIAVEIEVWQEAGFVWNANNLPKDPVPPPVPPPRLTRLRLRCPLPGTALHLGRTPCILIAEREIPIRRTYMSTNSASLVRWPDLTPLPVIAMSVETDFDSWCWGLSATLAGPAAWDLVQPNPLACEVQATINGQVWRFLLDVPSTNRSFNSDRVTLKGRSRSAWLHDPYTLSRNFSENAAREMVQLAEAAIANTGWTLDWTTENWVVPAYRYNSWNTPIGVLIRLMNTTDDGLYTHPYLQVITTRKRWPVASWLLDGATMDLAIPESAVLSLTQNPVYSQPLNGVYISGTSHGALALVKIAGTDGALQPADPIVDELLCDEAGVAARARGLNALSDSGAGWEMDAEVLFTPEVGLIHPGLIVSIAGLKGISRSVRIQCNLDAGGLSVRQSVGLERREVEGA